MNTHQKFAIAAADVAIIAELCLSLYISNKDLENFTSVFFKYFFVMLVPTLILLKVFVRRLGSGESS